MKRLNAHKGRSETSGRRPPESSPDFGRIAPRLVIELVIEELPRIELRADTAEDQIRVVTWATHPATISRLRDALADALDRDAA